MNGRCDVCPRSWTWEVHWRDGEVSFLCGGCSPSIADPDVVLARDGKYDWMTEADV